MSFDRIASPSIKENNKVLRDLKSVLKKLNIMKVDPLEELMAALDAGASSFGTPDRLYIDPRTFEQLKNITFNNKNLKP